MLSQEVLELARARFPGQARGTFEVLPIEKGGSDRMFFRARTGEGHSLIIVSYCGKREENARYVDLACFLASAGVNVPTIYHHDPGQGLIFMEDLGETDLWHFRGAPWSELRALYSAALHQMVRLHAGAADLLPGSGISLHMEFDSQLYLWEQSYFFQHCLGDVLGVPENQAAELSSLPRLREAAEFLSTLPRVIVHRDFQSQNVLIDRGSAWLIDFQGMRPGLPHYDLASLIYDPYVGLTHDQRSELIEIYLRKADEAGFGPGADFSAVLDLCAMQRLMQALGAYGFLGKQRGKAHFLQHVRPASESLCDLLPRVGGLDPLSEILNEYRHAENDHA